MASHFKSYQNVLSALQQLIKHGRFHAEIVEEGLWDFYPELLHQSGVMSIQPSSLLCQPWTGMLFSASSGPVSFLSLCDISLE